MRTLDAPLGRRGERRHQFGDLLLEARGFVLLGLGDRPEALGRFGGVAFVGAAAGLADQPAFGQPRQGVIDRGPLLARGLHDLADGRSPADHRQVGLDFRIVQAKLGQEVLRRAHRGRKGDLSNRYYTIYSISFQAAMVTA